MSFLSVVPVNYVQSQKVSKTYALFVVASCCLGPRAHLGVYQCPWATHDTSSGAPCKDVSEVASGHTEADLTIQAREQPRDDPILWD